VVTVWATEHGLATEERLVTEQGRATRRQARKGTPTED
jgi:hypothetical protein